MGDSRELGQRLYCHTLAPKQPHEHTPTAPKRHKTSLQKHHERAYETRPCMHGTQQHGTQGPDGISDDAGSGAGCASLAPQCILPLAALCKLSCM